MGVYSKDGKTVWSNSATLVNGTLSATLYTSANANSFPHVYSVVITTDDTAQQTVTLNDGTKTVIYLVGGASSNPPVIDQSDVPIIFTKGATITVTAGAVTSGKHIYVNVRGLISSS